MYRSTATNYERAFAERPQVYAVWAELNGAIRAGMDLRRHELATSPLRGVFARATAASLTARC